ncbi:MAG: ATP-binding cassette domain-containing protein, partial [Clostridia bacterium]|nr:ATP-binding cassette domain-containing protein [Clostridia bacterium]
MELQTHRGINDLSLTVNEGEFLALVGHNGSGKSTLAKTFNGLVIAQKGSIEVLGLNPTVEKE